MRKLPKKGALTIAFDDGYLHAYNFAIRYLDELNINATIALPSALIGKRFENRPLVGLKELKDIIESGHEVASHTITHPDLLRLISKDKKEARYEISKSKTMLENLLHYKVNSFVFPYIRKNQSKILGQMVRGYYKSSRETLDKPYFNKIPLRNTYSIVGFAITKKHSLSYLNRLIDAVEKNKHWLVEVFHLVSKKNTLSAHRPKPYRFFMHIDDFKKHIDYILSKDLIILTEKDAVRKLV